MRRKENEISIKFSIFEEEEQAKKFCKDYNKAQTYYMRKKHPCTYTVKDEIFVCWFYW